MSRLSAALALNAMTALAGTGRMPDIHPISLGGGPPRPKEPGAGECKCGRRISYLAGQCAACAGVTDTPTARRLVRALERQRLRLTEEKAIADRRAEVGRIIGEAILRNGGSIVQIALDGKES